MPRGKATPKLDGAVPSAEQVRMGVLTMKGLASLWGVDVKTLHNRKASDLPRHSKVGGKRLFFEADVLAYMRKRMSR